MAEKFAREEFDLPVPEVTEAIVANAPAVTATDAASSSNKSVGLLGRLFSNRKVGPDGKPMFKDYGDWGTYDGEVDDSGDTAA